MKEKARLWSDCLKLRLCLFWVKITSGNAFPEMRLFGWSGKFYFPEIEIRWLKKKAFDHWNRFTLLFSLQSVSGKWERERESARDRDLPSAPIAISPANIPVAVDRDLAVTRSRRWSRSRLCEIASDRDRDWRRDLVKRRSRDLVCRRERKIRDRDRRFARSCRRSQSRSGAISRRQDRDQLRNLATARSRSTATGMFAGEIAIGADWRSRSRARSLSLSLSLSAHFP